MIIENIKQAWQDATPEERALVKGICIGIGTALLGKLIGDAGLIPPDPANRQPWIGEPPAQS